MLRIRPLATGLLLLAALTGCTDGADDGAEPTPGPAAYAPPSGAPEFCGRLADAAHIDDIPAAVGAIAADARSAEARSDLTAAVGELRDVLDGVRAGGGHPRLDAALDDLVTALIEISAGPLTEETQRAITSNLETIGQQTQPVCEFPR